ncbi:stalk domain-containing protein [Thermoanaerobacter uzonensis]|nr:stalk domain-containing protein [Thermoanaerobacter uzonensis]
MSKTKGFLYDNITDPIATIIAPLIFLLFVIWALYFFTTPTPSYFYLNSNVADIGIRPISNENFILGQSTKRMYLKEAPFIYDSKIYLPLDAIVLASGIKEENVVKEKNRIIIKTEKSNNIYFDLKEKTVTIGREKMNLGSSLLVKNSEVFLSADYVEKIFKVKIEKDGNVVIMKYKLFPIPFD